MLIFLWKNSCCFKIYHYFWVSPLLRIYWDINFIKQKTIKYNLSNRIIRTVYINLEGNVDKSLKIKNFKFIQWKNKLNTPFFFKSPTLLHPWHSYYIWDLNNETQAVPLKVSNELPLGHQSTFYGNVMLRNSHWNRPALAAPISSTIKMWRVILDYMIPAAKKKKKKTYPWPVAKYPSWITLTWLNNSTCPAIFLDTRNGFMPFPKTFWQSIHPCLSQCLNMACQIRPVTYTNILKLIFIRRLTCHESNFRHLFQKFLCTGKNQHQFLEKKNSLGRIGLLVPRSWFNETMLP